MCTLTQFQTQFRANFVRKIADFRQNLTDFPIKILQMAHEYGNKAIFGSICVCFTAFAKERTTQREIDTVNTLSVTRDLIGLEFLENSIPFYCVKLVSRSIQLIF